MSLKYRILIPVTNRPDLVRYVFDNIPDKSKLTVVNNYGHSGVNHLCRKVHSEGAELYEFPLNLGVAASWNIGLREMMEEQNDVVIILSASVVFDKSFQTLLDLLERKWEGHTQVTFDRKVNLHCSAFTRLGVELGGYFDETFWPIYREDTDYYRRSKLNGFGEKVWRGQHGRENHPDGECDDSCVQLVHSAGASLAIRDEGLRKCHVANSPRTLHYYQRKWGGDHFSERFLTPFNEVQEVNEWIKPSHFHNPLYSNITSWEHPKQPYKPVLRK